MPQTTCITRTILGFSLMMVFVMSCSDPNKQAPFNADSGHPANWLPAAHMTAAETGLDSCKSCHGTDFSGGISEVSCTLCHMGNATTIHPLAWQGDACSNHGDYALNNGTTGCANAWCHGTSLGGVSESGPSCTKCHTPIPTSHICGTCHGIPPDGLAPAGNVYPNLPGAHGVHSALNGITCEVCHDRPCEDHANGVLDILFDAAFNAKSGVASYATTSTSKTCSEISCHGGTRTQTLAQMQQDPAQSTPAQTPDWYTGAINVDTQCSACHIYGTSEYNSYSSGQHFFHLGGEGVIYATCIDCHDTTKLAVGHFSDLRSNTISAGTASATIHNYINYDGTTCSYGGSGCHGGSYAPRNWWQ